jgi:excisionase family DNA binding protein
VIVVEADGLLTPAQAAQWLAVSKRTVERLMAAGSIEYVRVTEKNRRIEVQELRRYIDSLKQQAAAPRRRRSF